MPALFTTSKLVPWAHYALLAAAVLVSAQPVTAAESARIIKTLDAHYYYPQNRGLRALSVNLDWEQRDFSENENRFLPLPGIVFSWKAGKKITLNNFQILESKMFSEKGRFDLLRFLGNYREIVVPKTLAQLLKPYQFRIKRQKNRRILLEATAKNQTILKYEFLIDTDRWQIRKIRFVQNTAPREVTSDLRYTRKNGRWLLAENRTKFSLGNHDMIETSRYFYRQVSGFWLLSKLEQTFQRDGKLIESYIFRAGDYRIN